MARQSTATAGGIGRSDCARLRLIRSAFRRAALAARSRWTTGLVIAIFAAPAAGQSNNVRITKLSDVGFGMISNLGADSVSSQSVCIYANTGSNGYTITASGSGSGGDFALASGPNLLNYEVQWNTLPGQATGTQLTPNLPLTGQVSSAGQQTCNSGPPTSASLIVVLRSSALSGATAGSYGGTLTLVVGPE